MKVLLIRPPYSFSGYPKIDLPLGLLYIGAMLEQEGHELEYVDGVFFEGRYKFSSPQAQNPDNIDYIEQSWQAIEKTLWKTDCSVAIVSCLFSPQFHNADRLAHLIKKIKPQMKVIAGGPHASVVYERILSHNKDFDIVCRGEGEYTVLEILKTLQEYGDLNIVANIAFRRNNEVVATEARPFIQDLNALPFPAYHLLDMEEFFDLQKVSRTRTLYPYEGSERGVTLITSRGCPYGCTFCSIHLHMGRKWRAHSAENVLKHMEILIQKYGVKYFHFEDDNFTFEKKRVENILDKIIEKGWDISWDTPNGVRMDTLDENLLMKMKKSGCTFLILGIESGSQYVLDNVIKKKLDLSIVKKLASLSQKVRIHMRAFYVIGLPGETKEQIQETIDYATKLYDKYDIGGGLGIIAPLFGTEIYETCQEKGYFIEGIVPENMNQFDIYNGVIKTEDFDPEYLREEVKLFLKECDRLKFKKLIFRLISSPRLLLYFIMSVLKDPQNMRQYISNVVIWYYMILDTSKR